MFWILFGLLSLAISQSDNKVKYNTTIFDSPIDEVIWCGASIVVIGDDDAVNQDDNESATHRKVLFTLTSKGVLYRSSDYGFKWTNITDQISQNFSGTTSQYRVSQVLQSPADSTVLYIIGDNGFSLRTFDCGRTYTSFNHSSTFFGYRLNRMDPKLMIAFEEKLCTSSDKICKPKYRREFIFIVYSRIHLSRDSGNTFEIILKRVREASWDKLLQYVMVPDNRIVTSYQAENGSYAVGYSDDYFKTLKVIRWDAFGYYQTPVYLFLLVSADSDSDGYDLEIAPSFSDNYTPQKIVLPLDDNTKHTFTVLDTSEGQVFLSISHDEDLPKLTNIYMSDATGNEFTASLLGNVRSKDTGNCDFEHVQGIEGVYIANVYDYSEVSKFRSKRKGVTDEADAKKRPSFDKLDPYKKTQITYDKGGNWHTLKAPKYDADGQALNCNGDCALNLKGRTESSANPIYSSGSSAGIIMATGNTGIFLSLKPTDLNTYLSRDGGHNWYEILAGSHIYEIGDHGGLIVIAKDDKATNTILFTWDEGQTFDKVKFSDKFFVEIDNILTEPSNMEQKFIAVGRQDSRNLGLVNDTNPADTSSSVMRGVITAFDFTSLHQRICTGQQDPTKPDSDYEFWVPMNFIGDKCLFGKKIKYLRRKRSSQCFNPEGVERKMIVDSCPCTEEDWECDFGYNRRIEGGDCKPMTDAFQTQSNRNKSPKDCKGTYKKSQGYKKIPGDSCEEGVYLGPISIECPNDGDTQEPVKEELRYVPDAPSVKENQKIKTVGKINKVQIEKDEEVQVKPAKIQKQDSFLEQNKQTTNKSKNNRIQIALFVLILAIIIFCLRSQLQGMILGLFQSRPVKKQLQRKNYYPANEEELQEQRKNQTKKKGSQESMALFKRDDEDDEAGL